jgi:PAS domain S-box-containing protein
MSGPQDISILAVGAESGQVAFERELRHTAGGQFQVGSASSADDALSELAAAEFDCVVSAYDLPGRDGVELLRLVRENQGDLPFVLVTAEDDGVVASKAVSAGVTEYVPTTACVDHRELLTDRVGRAINEPRDPPHRRAQDTPLFEAMFEDAGHPIIILNPSGRVRTANETAMDHVDATREAVTDTLLWETPWWDEGLQSDVRRWVERAASGERVEYETTGVQLGDSVRSVTGEVRPVTGEEGVVSALVVVAQDTAERRRRERELLKTREALSLALDAADAAVWEMDLETEELHWDERAQRLWGYEPGEFAGTFEEFAGPVHPEDWERLETAYCTAIENCSSYAVEVRVVPDGEPLRWVRAAGQVMTDGDGEPRRLVGLSTDVTERREREEQLQRQNERLNEFVSVVSHDLRNPLNVAQARAAILQQQDDRSTEHLGPITTALERMEGIIENTLTLARQGKTISEMNTVSLTDLVERCWAGVETADATLEVKDVGTVQGDHDRLRHVFENLFSNAVTHGGDDVTVRVGRAGDDCLYVEDDGPGIPAWEREEVFQPGQTSVAEGTGFGLTIVRRIADAHGWEVTVTDGRDGGARFEFDTAGLSGE